ncbi:MAG: ABC transporter permease [Conexibacter sp.]
MSDVTTLLFSTALVASAVRLAVPIMIAAVGEAISERAGVLNIGLEGMMLTGALAGVLGAHWSGSPWVGVLVAMAAAMAIALPHGYLSINLGADQIVSGVGLNLVALGLTTFVNRETFGTDQQQVAHFNPLNVPGLSHLPVVGEALFQQHVLVYLAPLIALAAWYLLFRSRWGLHWRAAGEDPAGLESTGVSVVRSRWGALLVCAALAGIAGAVISLGELFSFSDNMTGGRGFIALALVIVARWNPLWAVAAALLFGATEALALRMQALDITVVPYELSLALPYLVTLLVYALAARSGSIPTALGRPFVRS